jgi:hypothetical protein
MANFLPPLSWIDVNSLQEHKRRLLFCTEGGLHGIMPTAIILPNALYGKPLLWDAAGERPLALRFTIIGEESEE